MYLNFQTQADIRAEIRIALAEIGRAATAAEIGHIVWNKCAVDGTMDDVLRTILLEVRRMADDGEIDRVDAPPHGRSDLGYYRPKPLDRLAAI